MRLQELNHDLLATIAGCLAFPELVRLGQTCSKLKQSTASWMESKRHAYLLPQRVADALVSAMDAHLRRVFDYASERVNHVTTWGEDLARVEYSLKDGTVNCNFPALVGRRSVKLKELEATVATESSGLITRYWDWTLRPEDLPEFRYTHGHDPPVKPIAYNDGLFAFMMAEGLFVGW